VRRISNIIKCKRTESASMIEAIEGQTNEINTRAGRCRPIRSSHGSAPPLGSNSRRCLSAAPGKGRSTRLRPPAIQQPTFSTRHIPAGASSTRGCTGPRRSCETSLQAGAQCPPAASPKSQEFLILGRCCCRSSSPPPQSFERSSSFPRARPKS